MANIYPLTPLQEGFLFHALANNDDSYIQQIAYVLEGRFDEQRFLKVWEILLARHDILRSLFFHTGAERPLQLVLKKQPLDSISIDLRHLDAAAQGQRRQQIKERDRRRGFRLDKDSLLRFTLLRLADDRTEVLWSHHHIILDGWSLGILLAECTALYQDVLATLPFTPPFSTYVQWLEKKDRQQTLAFWRDYLQDYQDEVKLPFTTLFPVSGPQRIKAQFTIPETLLAAIRQLSQGMQVSLNTIFQGAWGILLARYNDTEDVVFGTAVSGRPAGIDGVEQMVGLFINTIPVRVRPEAGLTVSRFLRGLQDQALQAEAHHYSPLHAIQSSHPLQNRLISTHLTFENFPLDERFKQLGTDHAAALQVQSNEIIERTHYPLDIQFLPAQHGIKVQMAYSADYDADMASRIEQHLCRILQQLCAAPEALTLQQIGLLDETEQHSLLSRCLALKQYPFDDLLQRFNAWVVADPAHTALVFQAQTLSYAQLDGYANAVCDRLHAAGLVPGAHVALCFERSLEMVVALLAVLKAGMVYVPMDTALPVDRMRFIVNDARAQLLLAGSEFAGLDGLSCPTLRVALDELEPRVEPVMHWRPEAQHPAYIIYTSGSTGEPKGVVVSHGNMARLFSAADELFDFSADDVWCLFHSYGFDFSVWELWGALRYGGKLVIVPYWLSRSPGDFYQLLAMQKVTVLNQTPTAFKLVCDVDRSSDNKLDALRYVVFGGEALDFKSLASWFQAYEQPQLVNMYGITETTVHVTYKRIMPREVAVRGSMIGKPLADLSVLVLDRYGELSAPGVPGELFVGGAGVSLGYLDRPALSVQRFVDLPQLAGAGRYYRTGDTGRYLDNGELEYFGRLDQQIQFHGFRIELGEIEQVLMRQPLIDQAVAVLLHDASRQLSAQGQQQTIVAYYRSQNGLPIAVAELRDYLSRYLPAYMVPGLFIHVARFPLTANGKIDKSALPAPTATASDAYQAPTSPQEQVLATVWAQVLQRPQISVEENFFALGGDSIQAIRVVSHTRQKGYALDVQDVFRYPTIRELASWLRPVEQRRKTQEATGVIALTPVQRWFFEQQPEHQQHFNHSALLEAASGDWQPQLVAQAWNRLLIQHAVLRCGFEIGEQGPQALIHAAGQVSVATVSLMAEADVDGAMVRHAETLQRDFNLAVAPLIRLTVYRCPSGDRLLVVIHHLLVDGVSWRILLEDFSTLYQAALTGQSAQLPEPSDSYADWAAGLAAYSRSQPLLAELPYWRGVIANRSGPSWAAKPCRYQDANSLHRLLPAEASTLLLEQANSAFNTSTEELLLSALIPALSAWAGWTHSLLLLEGHGREPLPGGLDVTRTVGWFTSLYPFCLSQIAGRDLAYQIKSVKENLRNVPGKGVGYGVLRYVTPPNETGGASLAFNPALVFNYLGRFDSTDDAGLYRILTKDTGAAVAPQALRPGALEFSAMVLSGELRVEWRYDAALETGSIQTLADLYMTQLLAVIDFCLHRAVEPTPSDLTYSALSLDELDDIFS
ncbi:MAG: amino acid adenylation domain-containing protein [Methylovulum sp.]|nr:amino acid adenylation domain-containing protein [Methylovulum sp.]